MKKENTILIVEDKEINRDFLVELLRDDYEILEASNGKEAMDILDDDSYKVSVVILDIIMPVMNGYDVLRSMKQKRYLPKIPVIVTSTEGDEESELKALSMGASDFFRKPYNPVLFRRELRILLHLENLRH